MLMFMCRLLTSGKIGCCSCASYSPWGRQVAVHEQVTHSGEDRLLFMCRLLTLGKKVAVHVPLTHPGEDRLLIMCRLLTLRKIGCYLCTGYSPLGR